MKDSRQKKLISSLAISALLATTAFTPLASFLASGNIYAAALPTPPTSTTTAVPTPPTSTATSVPTPPTSTATTVPTPPIVTTTATNAPVSITPTVIGASGATPPSSNITVNSPGQLTNLNTATVQVTYTCGSATGGQSLSVTLNQLPDTTTNTGTSLPTPALCDNQQHTLPVPVPTTGTFSAGPASAVATLEDLAGTPIISSTNQVTLV